MQFQLQHQTFLELGTSFVEENLSKDGGRGEKGSDGNTSNGNDGEQQMKLCLLALAHLLLWVLVPNRTWTGTGSLTRGWGPLLYMTATFYMTLVL